MILSLLAVFAITCIFKGDINVVNAINDSWNGVLIGNSLEYTNGNSIGALGWDTRATIFGHIKGISGAEYGLVGFCFWPIFWCVTYYLLIFFFRAFAPLKSVYGQAEQTRLGALYITASVCLLPMFYGLSCDYGRLYQYAAVSTFAAFLIVNPTILDKILPKWVYSLSVGINSVMCRLITPQRGVLAALVLFIGISPASFNLNENLVQSPVGAICQAIPMVLYHIAKLII